MSTTAAPAGTRPPPRDRDPLPLHRRDRRRGARHRSSAWSSPSFAVRAQAARHGFVALIKMMIQPVIFCTIVLGVGSVRSAARVGKVGGLALGYFITMSTVALAIGLVVGNIIHPGDGPATSPTTSPARARSRRRRAHGSTTEFLLGIIPDHAVLLADLRRGAADAAGRAAGRLRAAGDGPRRRAGPARHRPPPAAGLPGAGDDHVGGADRRVRRDRGGGRRDRRGRAEEPGRADDRLLHHLLPVRLRASSARCSGWPPASTSSSLLQVPRPRVPADRVDVVVGVGAAAADREDGARRRRQADRRRRRPDRLLVQPRRHRDLPDDGVAVHRRGAGRPAVASASRSRCWCS